MSETCVMCGDPARVKVEVGKLTLHFCGETKCKALFNYKVNDSIPIVWINPQDVWEHDHITDTVRDYYNEHIEEFYHVANEAIIDQWDQYNFGETFDQICDCAAPEMEKRIINKTPFEDLPLLDPKKFITEDGKDTLRDRFEEGK